MSMYFIHNHFSPLTDNIFESVFLHSDSSTDPNVNHTHISIKLKKKSIDFFFNKDDKDHPVNVHHHQHLFTLPLDTPERTDYFLLNARDYDGDIKSLTPEYRLFYASILPDKKTFEVDHNHRLSTIHELLLCLFDELNNPESDINKYCPDVANQAKHDLEKSDVYKLIQKKYNFYKSLYELLESNKLKSKAGDVKAFYIEYLTVILNDYLAKKIPVHKLASGNWFQNPQQEIEHLERINNEHSIDIGTKKNIQNYYLKKHAVLSALQMTSGKFFRLIISFQIFSFLCFTIVWIFWLNRSYRYTDMIVVAGAISFLASVTIILFKQKNINLIMPRVLVAISLVLYAIVGSEVILKNQLLVDERTLIMAIVSAVVILIVFIYAECRQHSQFYRSRYMRGLFNYKISPVLIYTFNAAVFLVIVTHSLVTNTFLKKSNVLTQEFEQPYESIKYIQGQYLIYNDKIVKAREQCELTIYNVLKKENTSFNPPLGPNVKERLYNSLKAEGGNIDVINENLYLNNILKKKLIISDSMVIIDIQQRNLTGTLLVWQTYNPIQSFLVKKPDFKIIKNAVDTLLNDLSRLTAANDTCKTLLDSLNKKLEVYKKYDNLELLVTYSKENINNKIPNYGFQVDLTKIYVIKSSYNNGKTIFKIYPRMLMLQVIIIMLVGLVGQLIISDKTVTEPL